MHCAQRLLFAGPIVVLGLLIIIVVPARTQTNSYEFNDSHLLMNERAATRRPSVPLGGSSRISQTITIKPDVRVEGPE